MTLCTTADVEALIQSDITNDQDPMVVAMLEMAGHIIDAELGRPAEGGTPITGELVRLAAGVDRYTILLPRWPITSVEQVTEDGTALVAGTDYTVDLDAGTLSRIDASSTPAGRSKSWAADVDISIDYTPATVPVARSVCAQAVARAFKVGANYANQPTVLAGLRQLTIGRWSATRQTEGATTEAAPLSLTAEERAVLRAHRDRRP